MEYSTTERILGPPETEKGLKESESMSYVVWSTLRIKKFGTVDDFTMVLILVGMSYG